MRTSQRVKLEEELKVLNGERVTFLAKYKKKAKALTLKLDKARAEEVAAKQVDEMSADEREAMKQAIEAGD